MVHLFEKEGKKTAVINVLIDPENGFLNPTLTAADGGALYVPDGEQVIDGMRQMIDESKGAIFILGQDYHPKNHISFMVNHPGIMKYRTEQFKEFLKEHNQPIPSDPAELAIAAQQPVHFFNGYDNPPEAFPFPELVLDQNRNIIGMKELDGRIRLVDVKTSVTGREPSAADRGRVNNVRNDYLEKDFDTLRAEGTLLKTQTLWTEHCIQGKKSSLYPEELGLPHALTEQLEGDLASPTIYARDADTDNEFYVIRKGANSELDSYGIGMENDSKTLTSATEIFIQIAEELEAKGCEQVIINVGGLASNFCVEFSANNVDDLLKGHFRVRGMEPTINFVPEISRGIPIPGGPEVPFSSEGVAGRLAKRGIDTTTLAEILADQKLKPGTEVQGDLRVAGLPERERARA